MDLIKPPREALAPIPLDPENFTPLARTPWAGRQIDLLFKSKGIDRSPRLIGESWEASCDPAFPSRIVGTDENLSTFISNNRQACLSQSLVAKGVENCEILVKLLNASEPLSLQLHPEDRDPNLTAGECGKPESWLVLHAEQNAGIYLGFKELISGSTLREKLQRGSDLAPLLQFVPVKAGDYFEINPGVVHAVGPGITLLEPQRVIPGKSGKTYRLWDWNRRYLADGSRDDQKGLGRELHIEPSLRILEKSSAQGQELLSSCSKSPMIHALAGASLSVYPANDYYQVFHFRGGDSATELEVSLDGGFAIWLQLRGQAEIQGPAGSQKIGKGEPFFLPSASFPCRISFSKKAEAAWVIPSSAIIDWKSTS